MNFEELMELLQSSLPAECGKPLRKEPEKPLEVIHKKAVTGEVNIESLLLEINDKMSLYNPAKVEPLLNELGNAVTDNHHLRSICELVSSFEFDEAIKELHTLAENLGFELEETDV